MDTDPASFASSTATSPPVFALPPSFPVSSTLLKQGAEGRVFLSSFLSRPCVVKQRFVKSYRHPSLDASLTRARLTAECRSLLKVRKAGVDAPCVYHVCDEDRLIVMERVDGVTVREWLHAHAGAGGEAEVAEMMRAIGRTVAAVHMAGVIHGDLTTSNILIRHDVRRDADGVPLLVSRSTHDSGGRRSAGLGADGCDVCVCWVGVQTMIDFGLSGNSMMVEDRAVDLYVLERAFISTHPNSQDKVTPPTLPLTAHSPSASEARTLKPSVCVRWSSSS